VDARQKESAEESADLFERWCLAPWVQPADEGIPLLLLLRIVEEFFGQCEWNAKRDCDFAPLKGRKDIQPSTKFKKALA
jgi:hypothetical protein